MKGKIDIISSKGDYLIVAGLWIIAEVLLFWKFGFNFQMEAEKYINEAKFILENHRLSQARYLFYFSTIFIIALSFSLKTGVYGAIVGIMIINLGSYLYFFKGLKNLFKNRAAAFVTILFLLTFWPYQSWSLFLYTECLFYSGVLILFSRLMLFEKIDTRFLFSLFFVLLFVVFSRPLGVLFIFPVLLFIYFHLSKKQKVFFYATLILAFFVLGWIVQVVFTSTPDWNMQRAFLEENIICDMPVAVTGVNLELSDHPNQLYRLFFYVTHNFSHFAGLALTRLKFFFLSTRSYYSSLHNAYLLITLGIIYGLIAIGFKNVRKTFSTALVAFIYSSICFFALTIAVQCDDYHNRFFLTLMPFLAVLALPGGSLVLKKGLFLFQNKV